LYHLLLKFVSAAFIAAIACASAPVYGGESKGGDSLEYKLAVINAETYVREDDLVVARFRSLLRQLDQTFAEDVATIGNISVKAKNMLGGEGIRLDMLAMMEGINRTKPLKAPKYAEYVGAYVVNRTQGLTHDRAIAGLNGVVEQMRR
jgi:hypothetical protein